MMTSHDKLPRLLIRNMSPSIHKLMTKVLMVLSLLRVASAMDDAQRLPEPPEANWEIADVLHGVSVKQRQPWEFRYEGKIIFCSITKHFGRYSKYYLFTILKVKTYIINIMSLSDLKSTENPTISVKKIRPFSVLSFSVAIGPIFMFFGVLNSSARVLSNFDTFLR